MEYVKKNALQRFIPHWLLKLPHIELSSLKSVTATKIIPDYTLMVLEWRTK